MKQPFDGKDEDVQPPVAGGGRQARSVGTEPDVEPLVEIPAQVFDGDGEELPSPDRIPEPHSPVIQRL